MDSLQLAIAMETECTSFYTNDVKLQKFADLNVILTVAK